jgi:predicted esterase
MTAWPLQIPEPHHGQPVLARGEVLTRARGAIIAIHGRDMSAEDMLMIAGKLDAPGFAILAPQARGKSWYPERFSSPIAKNEPWLTSSLAAIDWLVRHCRSAGLEKEKLALLGFSQGACLVLEYSERNPASYGAIVGLAGALFGPLGTTREPAVGLAGTPVFMGCSEVDPYIPKDHLMESAGILAAMGAAVDLRLYPNLGHRVNLDEIHRVNAMLSRMPSGGESS